MNNEEDSTKEKPYQKREIGYHMYCKDCKNILADLRKYNFGNGTKIRLYWQRDGEIAEKCIHNRSDVHWVKNPSSPQISIFDSPENV